MREGATRPVMSAPEVEAFLEREFPEIYLDGRIWHVEAVGPLTARMRLDFHPRHVRPGGTLSGPSMMTLADLALYVAVLANVGPVALAVTTSLSFNFLRKPPQAALVADTRLLKLGRRLAVGEVTIRSDGAGEPVCHATGTYALPG
ncbi:PaaI family thioesterase [Salinarimonas sp. NSM]|uniref:PaaI family thioesterase n=1 Tax=Salinarimonas sp. NSM TaxID=3458003 RepID=UPI0040375A39